MKKLTLYLFVILSLVLTVLLNIAFAAAPAAPALAAAAPSLVDWAFAHSAAIFGVLLAISEFLSLIPAFQGNGILDTIIKALRTLSQKPQDGQ